MTIPRINLGRERTPAEEKRWQKRKNEASVAVKTIAALHAQRKHIVMMLVTMTRLVGDKKHPLVAAVLKYLNKEGLMDVYRQTQEENEEYIVGLEEQPQTPAREGE